MTTYHATLRVREPFVKSCLVHGALMLMRNSLRLEVHNVLVDASECYQCVCVPARVCVCVCVCAVCAQPGWAFLYDVLGLISWQVWVKIPLKLLRLLPAWITKVSVVPLRPPNVCHGRKTCPPPITKMDEGGGADLPQQFWRIHSKLGVCRKFHWNHSNCQAYLLVWITGGQTPGINKIESTRKACTVFLHLVLTGKHKHVLCSTIGRQPALTRTHAWSFGNRSYSSKMFCWLTTRFFCLK